jgi:leucyl/phenylalanyl-tRNA--protein transferase
MGFRIRTLSPADPADTFPDPASAGIALGYPDGLLAIGGDLSLPRLLYAYQHGIFPWFNEDQPILWWSPDPRAVIFPDQFHKSRSLRRMLRKDGWEYSLNAAFATVLSGCATDRGPHGTWITPDMLHAYLRMHDAGHAHSAESWHNGELAGGVYGIRLGNVFFAESMFSRETGGSKVALSGLIQECIDQGIVMLDCQLPSEHLYTLGMELIPRLDFLRALQANIADHRPYPDWRFAKRPALELASLR